MVPDERGVMLDMLARTLDDRLLVQADGVGALVEGDGLRVELSCESEQMVRWNDDVALELCRA